jgi:hypothetical protein
MEESDHGDSEKPEWSGVEVLTHRGLLLHSYPY